LQVDAITLTGFWYKTFGRTSLDSQEECRNAEHIHYVGSIMTFKAGTSLDSQEECRNAEHIHYVGSIMIFKAGRYLFAVAFIR
jgi:hypothetical protein